MPVLDAYPSSAAPGLAPCRRAPVGVVVNPHARRNRRGTALPDHGQAPDLHFAAPRTADELPAVLAHFAGREVATLVIDGGDGTVRDVLSALPAAFGEHQPALVLVPSGTTNLIARNTGGIPAGPAGLARLLRSLEGQGPLREKFQRCLDVRWPDRPDRFVRGTILGAAAYAECTELARCALAQQKPGHALALPRATAAMVRHALFGAGRGRLLEGEPMSVSIDGGSPGSGNHFLVLATSLSRLMCGLWPFAEAGEGSLHWLDIAAPPRHLLRTAATVLCGRAPRAGAMERQNSGRAREIAISGTRPFIIDGDQFEMSAGGVRLAASPPLRFLSA
jgi:hypothetical protein